ncbi:hypothetical protein [Streptomyces sp. SID3343]|uniref:hypothetical protein n=1 Tax=Streptomyces sp. SID3343 TaxID=2690260 RepID=UPI0013716B01|nr:hypothetical protein [Streptomyces sp. SID3343]MYW05948.1 hypothetical protein [Streptomyces sp. SID3343]
MNDFTHDDDLFSVVSDDTIDTLDTADGGTDAAAPLWDTDSGGTVVGDAYPNPDGTFGDPNYNPYVYDTDGDGVADVDDASPFDPYGPGSDPDTAPQRSEDWRNDQLENAEQQGYDPQDPYADPYGDPSGYDPYADPSGYDPYADPAGYDPSQYDPAGYDPGGYGDYEHSAYAPWGADIDENGNMAYTPPNWTPDQFDGAGDPVGDAQYWQQQTSPTSCAVVTQGMILEKLTGMPLDENALMTQAEQAGIYDPQTGTQLEDIGKLLEMNGVDADQVQNADMFQLLDSLERGDQVIVGLDANEIWQPMHDTVTDAPLEQNPPAGHAVWVTGIDTQPDGSVYVLLNDPGAPFGSVEPIPLQDFVNAWQDFGSDMTVAHPVGA